LDVSLVSTNKAILPCWLTLRERQSAAFDGKTLQEELLTTKDTKEHKEMCQSPEKLQW
jgi:hypothetical protein